MSTTVATVESNNNESVAVSNDPVDEEMISLDIHNGNDNNSIINGGSDSVNDKSSSDSSHSSNSNRSTPTPLSTINTTPTTTTPNDPNDNEKDKVDEEDPTVSGGGQLKFFKDGMLCLQLAHQNTGNGKNSKWVQIRTKTVSLPVHVSKEVSIPLSPAPTNTTFSGVTASSSTSRSVSPESVQKRISGFPKKGASSELIQFYMRPAPCTIKNRKLLYQKFHKDLLQLIRQPYSVCMIKKLSLLSTSSSTTTSCSTIEEEEKEKTPSNETLVETTEKQCLECDKINKNSDSDKKDSKINITSSSSTNNSPPPPPPPSSNEETNGCNNSNDKNSFPIVKKEKVIDYYANCLSKKVEKDITSLDKDECEMSMEQQQQQHDKSPLITPPPTSSSASSTPSASPGIINTTNNRRTPSCTPDSIVDNSLDLSSPPLLPIIPHRPRSIPKAKHSPGKEKTILSVPLSSTTTTTSPNIGKHGRSKTPQDMSSSALSLSKIPKSSSSACFPSSLLLMQQQQQMELSRISSDNNSKPKRSKKGKGTTQQESHGQHNKNSSNNNNSNNSGLIKSQRRNSNSSNASSGGNESILNLSNSNRKSSSSTSSSTIADSDMKQKLDSMFFPMGTTELANQLYNKAMPPNYLNLLANATNPSSLNFSAYPNHLGLDFQQQLLQQQAMSSVISDTVNSILAKNKNSSSSGISDSKSRSLGIPHHYQQQQPQQPQQQNLEKKGGNKSKSKKPLSNVLSNPTFKVPVSEYTNSTKLKSPKKLYQEQQQQLQQLQLLQKQQQQQQQQQKQKQQSKLKSPEPSSPFHSLSHLNSNLDNSFFLRNLLDSPYSLPPSDKTSKMSDNSSTASSSSSKSRVRPVKSSSSNTNSSTSSGNKSQNKSSGKTKTNNSGGSSSSSSNNNSVSPSKQRERMEKSSPSSNNFLSQFQQQQQQQQQQLSDFNASTAAAASYYNTLLPGFSPYSPALAAYFNPPPPSKNDLNPLLMGIPGLDYANAFNLSQKGQPNWASFLPFLHPGTSSEALNQALNLANSTKSSSGSSPSTSSSSDAPLNLCKKSK